MIRKLLYILVFLGFVSTHKVMAQDHSVRINIPSLLVGNINADLSVRLSRYISFELQGQVKPIDFKVPAPIGLLQTILTNRVDRHNFFKWGLIDHSANLIFQPGIRYWSNGVYNRGVFFGANIIGGVFKYGGTKINNHVFDKGMLVGGGLSIGYSYELSPLWNIEGEFGLGLIYSRYKTLYRDINTFNFFDGKEAKLSFVPTKLSVSLVYLF